MSKATNDVRDLVTKALTSAAASPSLSIDQGDVPSVAARVVAEVAPAIDHLTNNENWWRSRVTWGAILSAIGTTSGLLGYTFAPELQGRVLEAIMLWVTVGGIVSGPLLTLWGRWVAKKPIGE